MRRTDQPRIPSYGLHKASGQARVRIDGRDIYLGRFDSPESHAEYRRVIGEYFAHGGLPPRSGEQLTVTELVAAYWAHRKSGRVDEATLANTPQVIGTNWIAAQGSRPSPYLGFSTTD